MIKQAGYLCCFEVLMPYIKPNLLLLEFGKRKKTGIRKFWWVRR
jgi:hypothetical protein